MDLKQTKVSNQNRSQFYQQMYPHQFESRSQLINIASIDADNIITVDCCGWHYKRTFAEKNVLSIDPIKAALEFKLPKDKVYKFVDNRTDHVLQWPTLNVDNCAVVFDRSPLLRYLTIDQLNTVLNDVQQQYQPKFIVTRLKSMSIDSDRLIDRFYSMCNIQIKDCVVEQFHYNVNYLYICFRKKTQV